MRTLLVLLTLAGCCAGSDIFTLATNLSVDLRGKPDTRPTTWGTAEAFEWGVDSKDQDSITFHPPTGQRVKILAVQGDLVAWPTEMGLKPAVIPVGRYAGVLLGLGRQPRSPQVSSAHCSLCCRDVFVYVQGVLSQQQSTLRIPLQYAAVNYILGPDHKLYVKVAVWLNDTGLAVHLEPTMTIQYQWTTETE